MRGDNLLEGLKFCSVKRQTTEWPGVPVYFDNALGISLMAADEYNIRNDRLIPEIYKTKIVQDTITLPRKASYSHIARRQAGGWGHVPETNPVTVERKEKIEQLRRDVKQEC